MLLNNCYYQVITIRNKMGYNKNKLEKLVENNEKWDDYSRNYHNPTRGEKDSNLMLELGKEIYNQHPNLFPDYPDGSYFIREGARPAEADLFIRQRRKDAEASIHEHVDKNFYDMIGRLSKLSPADLYEFASSLPLRETGYPFHDKVVKMILEINKMQSLLSNEKRDKPADIGAMHDYILKNVIKKDKSALELYATLISKDKVQVESIFKYFVMDKMKELEKMFLRPKGELDDIKIRGYTINTVEDIRIKEGKDSDSLKRAYLALAHQLNDIEEGKQTGKWKSYLTN